jgi:mRNA-degrading endonuclease RelE of RelBE toxin-antitoxin system
MKINLTEKFRKSYSKLPTTIRKKFDQKLTFFVQDPNHPSLNLHRINDYWEFYIDKKYRCILRKDNDSYFFVAIGGHEIVDKFRFTLR